VTAGSPRVQVVEVKVAVAVTDTPPAATVADTVGAASTQSQVQRLTAALVRSGPILIVGIGIRSSAIACRASTSGDGGAGVAGGSPAAGKGTKNGTRMGGGVSR
jgi:hypothetical protein